MQKSIGWFLIAAVSVFLCSCGSGERARRETFPVTGKVTVDGNPVADLKVIAVAKKAGDPDYPIVPQGMTKEDGSFELYSYEPGDGVPAGEYALTFRWQERKGLKYTGPDKLNGRYEDPAASTFPLKVESAAVDMGTIALTTQ